MAGVSRKLIVIALARVDEAVDEVLYRPAVVNATLHLPCWWLCDLAGIAAAG